jgi:hypothetical protein
VDEYLTKRLDVRRSYRRRTTRDSKLFFYSRIKGIDRRIRPKRKGATTISRASLNIELKVPSYDLNLAYLRLDIIRIFRTINNKRTNIKIILLVEYTSRYSKIRTKLRYL